MAENEWTGVVNVVMPKYLKGAEDLTIRGRLPMRLMERRGRITTNHSSTKQIWEAEYQEPPVEAYGDGGQLTFARGDYYKQAEQDWRGYKATDMMTEKEKDMCGSDVLIVKRYTKKIPKLIKALRNKFNSEFLIDGNASGNGNRMHGCKSWSGDDGNTTAADRIANPSDTFANISTTLGQYDSWTSDLTTSPNATNDTDWPEGGEGDTVGYDYWSPKLANWSSTNWGTGQTTWIDNAEFVLRKLLQWLRLTSGVEASALYGLLAGDLMTDFANAMSSKGRSLLPHPQARDLGFPDVLNFDGLMLEAGFGITANQGWVWNLSEMELQSLKPTLFGSKGPDWSPKDAAFLYQAGFFGNIMWTAPKYHGHLKNYA